MIKIFGIKMIDTLHNNTLQKLTKLVYSFWHSKNPDASFILLGDDWLVMCNIFESIHLLYIKHWSLTQIDEKRIWGGDGNCEWFMKFFWFFLNGKFDARYFGWEQVSTINHTSVPTKRFGCCLRLPQNHPPLL